MSLDQRARLLYESSYVHYVPPWGRLTEAAREQWRMRVLETFEWA
jgi:hypothetical protein